MLTLLIVAQVLLIVPSAPPLSPADAVRVLQASKSPADMTDFRAAATPTLPPSPVVVGVPRHADPTHKSPTEFRPLNCCGTYSTPLPVPEVNVNLRKER